MRRLSDSDCLIQCFCGSSTADGLNNLECSHCGYYVHGACYRISSGPVVCGPCSIALDQPCSDPRTQDWYLNQSKLSPAQREDHQNRALVDRLILALSTGEHIRYFGDHKSISHVYLRIKFNIDATLAEKLFQLAVCEEILLVDPDDGSVQFNQKVDRPPDLKHPEESCKLPKLKFEDKTQSDTERDDEDETEDSLPPLNVQLVEGDDRLDPSHPDDNDENSNQKEILKKDGEEGYVEVKIEPDLIFNQENSLPQSKTYSCPMCDYVTNKSINLSRHKKSTHEFIRYPCDQCSFTGTKRDHLNQHKKTVHLGVRYQCDQCEHSSSSPSSLRKHKRSKHDGIRFSCDLCNFTASQQSLIKRHKEAKHEGVLYYCDQCTYTAACKSLVSQHKKNKHDGIRFPCELCSYMATKRSDLNQHKKRIHEKVKYYCDICEYSCSSRAILRHHKESKHEGVTYMCEQCTYVSLSQNSLKNHVETVHDGIRYPCDHCNYEATQKQNLERHKRNAHGTSSKGDGDNSEGFCR